jgi:hypothetical protein
MGKTTLAIRAAELTAPGHYDDLLILLAKQAATEPHGPHGETPPSRSASRVGIDLIVDARNELHLYEIKCDLSPRTVIRQALGQLLEYAYHPPSAHRLPVRMIIVGRCELGDDERTYLDHLKVAFRLPLEYKVLSL